MREKWVSSEGRKSDMATSPHHYKDELQDWLDQRLDAATCDEVERHLEACAECRREYEAMAWTKQQTTRRLPPVEAPAELRGKILQSLRAAPPVGVIATAVPAVETVSPAYWRQRLRPLLAAAAVVMVAAVLAAYWLKPAALPAVAARDFRAYVAQKLALELSTGDVKAMEAFFSGHGVPFNTRVFDLGMMNYQLVGGLVQQPGAKPRALFVYRGAADQKLVCQMFAGKVDELPKGATLRENKGIRFHIYQEDGLTAVFWQEGAVVCVLVSDIEPEKVVQLAFAKAMP